MRIGAAALAVAPVVAVDELVPDSGDLRWKSSSAASGFTRGGRLGDDSRRANLLLHTVEEQDPWLEIDLGEARPVETVAVLNRLDCCRSRGLPLVLERRDGDRWTEVARRTEPFVRWSPTFEPFVTRRVRLRAASRTTLHLGDVQVR